MALWSLVSLFQDYGRPLEVLAVYTASVRTQLQYQSPTRSTHAPTSHCWRAVPQIGYLISFVTNTTFYLGFRPSWLLSVYWIHDAILGYSILIPFKLFSILPPFSDAHMFVLYNKQFVEVRYTLAPTLPPCVCSLWCVLNEFCYAQVLSGMKFREVSERFPVKIDTHGVNTTYLTGKRSWQRINRFKPEAIFLKLQQPPTPAPGLLELNRTYTVPVGERRRNSGAVAAVTGTMRQPQINDGEDGVLVAHMDGNNRSVEC